MQCVDQAHHIVFVDEIFAAHLEQEFAEGLATRGEALEKCLGELGGEQDGCVDLGAENAACAFGDQVWHQPVVQRGAEFGAFAGVQEHQRAAFEICAAEWRGTLQIFQRHPAIGQHDS